MLLLLFLLFLFILLMMLASGGGVICKVQHQQLIVTLNALWNEKLKKKNKKSFVAFVLQFLIEIKLYVPLQFPVALVGGLRLCDDYEKTRLCFSNSDRFLYLFCLNFFFFYSSTTNTLFTKRQ